MNIVISLLALISIVIGMMSMVTPIPGGTILIAGGLTALICSSAAARYCLMWVRTRFAWFNKTIFWLEKKVGTRVKTVGSALAKTQPPEGVSTPISHKEFVLRELSQDAESKNSN